ncbi:MAG: hypothetical protein JO016_17865 [Actinobacteria bacterium]|nr:hypothetical protein [Actinomycetota bacterium]
MPAIRACALALAMVVGYFLAAPGGLTVASAAVLAAMLTGLVVAVVAGSARRAAAVTAVPLHRRASGLQEKSWCAGFLRQRDPDAAGRSRPRAPSARPAAA